MDCDCGGQTKPNSALPKRAAAFLGVLFLLLSPLQLQHHAHCANSCAPNSALTKTTQPPRCLQQTSSCCTSPLSQPAATTSFAQATPPLQTLTLYFNAALVCTIQIDSMQTKMPRDHHVKTQIFSGYKVFFPLSIITNHYQLPPKGSDKQKILQYLPRPLTSVYKFATCTLQFCICLSL